MGVLYWVGRNVVCTAGQSVSQHSFHIDSLSTNSLRINSEICHKRLWHCGCFWIYLYIIYALLEKESHYNFIWRFLHYWRHCKNCECHPITTRRHLKRRLCYSAATKHLSLDSGGKNMKSTFCCIMGENSTLKAKYLNLSQVGKTKNDEMRILISLSS